MYFCRFCQFCTGSVLKYIAHKSYHRNICTDYYCGFQKCSSSFKSEVSLRLHYIRNHKLKLRSSASLKNNAAAMNDDSLFECNSSFCSKKFVTFSEFMKHLKSHITFDGMTVKCPFKKCSNTYNKINSLSCHVSREHKSNFKPCEASLVVGDSENRPQNVTEVNDGTVDGSGDNSDFFLEDTGSDGKDALEVEIDYEGLFKQNVAQFYLKLESELLLPATTVQTIFEELSELNRENCRLWKDNLKSVLTREGISEHEINAVMRHDLVNDPLLKTNCDLESNFKRKAFYKQTFSYVQPEEIQIGDDHFAYVPIPKTLKEMLNDKWLSEYLNKNLENPVTENNSLLQDISDGDMFKSNPFFRENPRALRLILYQDGFEIVNPLGSAKKKHKLLAVYMSVLNLPAHLRSHVNTMQLVALCKEKCFEHKKVFGRIVDDLSLLEEVGIEVSENKVIKAGLVCICGDNLGSHSLGGFLENFSSANFFCRYCLTHREDLNREDRIAVHCEPRTVQSYKNSLNCLTNGEETRGVKFDSTFNRLRSFHVCNPGLPPCLGHDLFEGVVAYDLLLFVDYFLKQQWFSLSWLNRRVDEFKYSPDDRKDKPCSISISCGRISGGACQVWTFLRLFPLLVEEKIVDDENPVWRTLMLLTEIVEIVCAPCINVCYLAYLQELIFEYLTLRLSLFPLKNLRPKHHFMKHYPTLIFKFGPLMKVWTLRFESKHSFFKRAIRFSRNFINVTKSLSEKHELFQSLLRSGAGSRCTVYAQNESLYVGCLYSSDIQEAVRSAGLISDIRECAKAVVKGTNYQKGDAFFVRLRSRGVGLGKCVLLLVSDVGKIYMVLQMVEYIFSQHRRSYELGLPTDYRCLCVEDLPLYQPLHVYYVNNRSYVKPKYGLVCDNPN